MVTSVGISEQFTWFYRFVNNIAVAELTKVAVKHTARSLKSVLVCQYEVEELAQ